MALFTVLLEFDGGTYISQLRATSAHNAAVKHAAHLIGNKQMSTLPEPAMVARDRVREIVTPLAESGDLTSAYVCYRQHTDEEPHEPARFVPRRSMMFRRRVG